MSEVVLDFHDRLKSVTRGFGSMDYVLMGFQREDLVRLDIFGKWRCCRCAGDDCSPPGIETAWTGDAVAP